MAFQRVWHPYFREKLGQLIEGDFLRHVNPKDIAFIAETESKIKSPRPNCRFMKKKKLYVDVENDVDSISISGADFLKDRDLVDKTESLDATKIAFMPG